MPKKNDIIVAYLNNQECFLHHSGVIFIPKIKAIIIYDIHFEKASALNIKKISTINLHKMNKLKCGLIKTSILNNY